MKTDNLRKAYLEFFKSRDHRIFPSDSLIPQDDPSLLFTGAGMNQFKPYFLGVKKDVRRAASCQKCLRTADLERVGKTAYHHSFFEMLGNFSFGDYFKDEAIAWGWEFVTRVLGLPAARLWVSVYEEDDEAFQIWKNKIGLTESKIRRMGAEDNFWPANAPKDGPNGPCGPCSEIYVGETPGKGVEIWNLVFTQFDRQSDGGLRPLPQKNIDTGMGLERTAAVLQGVESNFDTDNFAKIRAELKLLFKNGGEDRIRQNAAMDHVRAAVFSIADGAGPSNEGRGYVVRKLIRLGSDHFEKAGEPLKRRTFFKLVPVIAQIYGAVYPEVDQRQKTIASIIENEEKAYEEACRRAEGLKPGAMNTDEYAFMLYDTYGLPMDKIREKFSKDGLKLDETQFAQYLNRQRERSRQASKIAGEIFKKDERIGLIDGLAPTHFIGDEKNASESALLRAIRGTAIVPSLKTGEEGFLIFESTPFYAEAGGQIGDTGFAEGAGFRAEILDTQWLERCILHKVVVKTGEAQTGRPYRLAIDKERRAAIMKNHTATHLLHAALRQILGEHAKQSGSLVAPDYLRFDFTHFKALEPAQLAAVENLVNEVIQKNIALDKKVISKELAMKEGAIAFFGEKYGEEVRVITIGGFSKELCGGTHLHSTGEIGLFKIVSESSIQAGVRRIEAVTGDAAKSLVEKNEKELGKILLDLKIRGEADIFQEIQAQNKRVNMLKNQVSAAAVRRLKKAVLEKWEKAPEIRGVRSLYLKAPCIDPDLARKTAEGLKAEKREFVALFQGDFDDKFSYIVTGTPAAVQLGFRSEAVVQAINAAVDGSGGGRPDFAVGGSKNFSLAPKVFEVGTDSIHKSFMRQL